MGSKPTIRDVAKEAGVSIATVSYVLNNTSGEVISHQVKARVWTAVRALNYHRAAAAVSLAMRRTHNIGVMLGPDQNDVTNPFYSFIIRGIIWEAQARDYNVLFTYMKSKYGGVPDLPKLIREANVAGMLFVGRVSRAALRDVQQLGIAVVAIDHQPRVKKIASIQIDNIGGGELVARHFLDLGHENLAFVGHVKGISSIVLRGEGFSRWFRHWGPARGNRVEVVPCELTFADGHRRSREFLESNRHVTAIFGANDEVAAGILKAAREVGREVPGNLSVVGFDDIIMANYTDPPLTTVNVGKEQMGRSAVTRLLDMIEGRRSDTGEDLVPAELVVRSSTAPRRAKPELVTRAGRKVLGEDPGGVAANASGGARRPH
ncbi:MAG TPA: LacI family DNA-binding transcriptional regulator [Polyangiaceae bacterium]|jgi:LacI family transcriptional regulator